MAKTYQWINKEKSRYYKITVEKYGINHIVLNYHWGGCNSNRGGKKNIFVQTEKEAQTLINLMIKRRKTRGYELILYKINSLGDNYIPNYHSAIQ